jgi:hypothetical protein
VLIEDGKQAMAEGFDVARSVETSQRHRSDIFQQIDNHPARIVAGITLSLN